MVWERNGHYILRISKQQTVVDPYTVPNTISTIVARVQKFGYK